MPRSDRLLTLAGCHGVLRHHGIRSVDEYRAAPPERLRQLHRYADTIRRLVAEAHPDVIRALWPPDPSVSWLVALVTTEPSVRLLDVTRGPVGGSHTTLLSHAYRVDDDGAVERDAWAKLVATLERRP